MELLEEQLSEGKPRSASSGSDAKIHFLFLYASVSRLPLSLSRAERLRSP